MTTLTAQHTPCLGLTPRGRRSGFTLIELLISMAVIAILAGILLPIIHIARVQAKVASTKTLLSQITGALGRYNEDWGHFPPDKLDTSSIIKYVGYDPEKTPANNVFSISWIASGEALYYYLANPNLTRKHPYLELQADVQFKNANYAAQYDQNKLRVAVDSWERPFLYNRPGWPGRGASDWNTAYDPLHSESTYDLFSVGPNGQTARMGLEHPKNNYTSFNRLALDTGTSGTNAPATYGDDEDDITSWD